MENNNNNTFAREEESMLQIADLWRLFWDHKWWYALSLAVCLAIAAFQLYRTPNVYNTTAKVMIDESGQDATMRNLGVASANMMRSRMGANPVDNEMEAIKSPDLMQTVVERLGLQTRYVEKQLFRNVELYPAPVEMRLLGDNPQYGFSFVVENIGDNQVALSDFKVDANWTCAILNSDASTAFADFAFIPFAFVSTPYTSR